MLCSKFFQVIVTIKICQGLTLFFLPALRSSISVAGIPSSSPNRQELDS